MGRRRKRVIITQTISPGTSSLNDLKLKKIMLSELSVVVIVNVCSFAPFPLPHSFWSVGAYDLDG